MPRIVRNWWIAGCKFTRDNPDSGKFFSFGPNTAKDAEMDLTIYQRHDGEVTEAVEIIGRATKDGQLNLTIRVVGSDEPITVSTRR